MVMPVSTFFTKADTVRNDTASLTYGMVYIVEDKKDEKYRNG